MGDAMETVIGLEVHVELTTETKLFCGCSTAFGAEPNTHVCPVCLGLPGVLPVANGVAIERSVLTALALGCRIAPWFKFDRKHYYYPDLPKNFQISQYDTPLSSDGKVELSNGRTIRIKRLHLEEDAGKLVHEGAGDRISGGTAALCDYNRAGIPLMEVVSEPDLKDPAEAVEYLKYIQSLVRYLGVSDANMEEGRLRCDANISVRPVDTTELGAKIEIKNMNSFRGVERALAHEAVRQREALAAGEKLRQETRLFDEDSGTTRAMRGKEGAQDYRYFPEPDLLPFTFDEARVASLRASLPELPAARRARYVPAFGLSAYDAEVLTADRATADYFEAVVKAGAPAKAASNWVMTELLGALNQVGRPVSASPVKAEALGRLVALIEDSTISGKIAKTVFAEMFASGKGPDEIVKEKGLVQITDEGAIRKAVGEVLAANGKSVADFKAGKQAAMGFLVGQVMKATGGKANPKLVNQLLKEELSR
jgi:aspartyl-tRNA(Asn)/glutamyl-tRNA(Gln) amidotransferase subunit B